MVFQLCNEAIQIESLSRQLCHDEAGGFVSFEGRVRNFNDGKPVLKLEYEAYSRLALNEGDKILAEAQQIYPIISASCVHRVGPLEIGEVAVWVGVLSKHRGEAFEACRYIIDEIKSRVPIWKKEYYADGTTTWVNCAECASHARARSAHEHA